MTSSTTTQIPGYVVGTWDIDASHSTVGFSVRHMMVSKVRGYFREFSGELVTAEDPARSSVTATIDLGSIDTRQDQRDAHIRSADFFDVDNHPAITFRSTEVTAVDDDTLRVTGDLTIKDVTQPVTVDFEFAGSAQDPFGNTRVGLEGKTVVDRKDFGLTWNAALETGGVLVSEKVTLEFDISAIKNA